MGHTRRSAGASGGSDRGTTGRDPWGSTEAEYARPVGDADATSSIARPRVLHTAYALVGGVVLWFTIATVYSSDRGLDLSDEGLYILAADPPSRTATWFTPWGWQTSLLLRLVGNDLARLRTLAVWLLVVLGGTLGWAIGQRVGARALAIVGAAGGPMLAASLLRTPGYNWVNLAGLLIGATGTIVATTLDGHHSDDNDDHHGKPRRRMHAAAALIALGVLCSTPAKPTSGPFLLIAAAALIVSCIGRRRTLRLAALVAAWAVAIVGLAVVTGTWPHNFASIILRSREWPVLHENQTLAGAVHDLLRTPKVAWHELRRLRIAAYLLIFTAAVTAALVRHRPNASLTMRCAPLALATIAAVGVAAPLPVLGGQGPAERFAWGGTVNAAVLLTAGAGLHLYTNWHGAERGTHRRSIAIAAFLVVLAFSYSFGSAIGVYHQTALAVVLLWLAAGVLTAATAQKVRSVAVAMIAIASTVMLVSNLVDSRNHPFRNVGLARQTTPIELGTHGAELVVDEGTASFVTRFGVSAAAGGWCAGTPLIGLSGQWSTTLSYALGARVPETLMITTPGYDAAVAVGAYTMRSLRTPRWHDAWLITSDPSTDGPKVAAQVRALLDQLPADVNRTFPADYTLVTDVDGIQLWRPTGAATACGTR